MLPRLILALLIPAFLVSACVPQNMPRTIPNNFPGPNDEDPDD